MLIYNTNNVDITGTRFGPLKQFPDTNILDSFLLTDLFGNSTFNYDLTSNGNSFYEPTDAAALSSALKFNTVLWLDSHDLSLIGLSSGSTTAITGMYDKFYNFFFYVSGDEPVNVETWPLTGTDLLETNCLKFDKNTILVNNDYEYVFDQSMGYSLYLVWRDYNNSFDTTIPFCIKTNYLSSISELTMKNQYLSTVQGKVGFKGKDGLYIENYHDIFYNAGLLSWEYFGSEFSAASSHTMFFNNSSISLSSDYFFENEFVYNTTGVGYIGDNNRNNFHFGELILFDKILSNSEKSYLYNYLSNKWNLNLYRENLSYSTEITGGPMVPFSYQDYSALTTVIPLPIQSCVTKLTISLSGYETSKSQISKVFYSYKDTSGEISSKFTGSTASFIDNKISIILSPNNVSTVESYFVYLSVFRQDTTINKFLLSGQLLKCGIRDFYKHSKLIDSQVANKSKDIILVSEDTDKSLVFLNSLDVTVPSQALSGGDLRPLINEDFADVEEPIFLLSILLEEETAKEKFKKPFTTLTAPAKINPITPE